MINTPKNHLSSIDPTVFGFSSVFGSPQPLSFIAPMNSTRQNLRNWFGIRSVSVDFRLIAQKNCYLSCIYSHRSEE